MIAACFGIYSSPALKIRITFNAFGKPTEIIIFRFIKIIL